MGNARISIVIPTKNEGKYIGATIEQFRDQFEKTDLEIIVSDANSTDETHGLVERYTAEFGAERIRLVKSDQKQNIAIGRNLGAAEATGDILFHMDADVRIPEKDRFFRLVFQKFEDPRVVAATVSLWVYPEEARFSDRLYHILMNALIRISFPLGGLLAKGECQIVRREIFEKIGGYNEKIVAGEDCNLFYRLHKEGRLAYLHRLKVYHSPRRFREYGYAKVTWIYLREGLWLLFRGKSYSEEWKPIR